MIQKSAGTGTNVLQIPLTVGRPHFGVTSTNHFGPKDNSGRVLCDEPVSMPPYHQDFAFIHFAIDGVEPEGQSGERIHCGYNPNGDFTSACCWWWSGISSSGCGHGSRRRLGPSTIAILCCDNMDVQIHGRVSVPLKEGWRQGHRLAAAIVCSGGGRGGCRSTWPCSRVPASGTAAAGGRHLQEAKGVAGLQEE
jgi:hypothetical protein